jgi:hypothetical protein
MFIVRMICIFAGFVIIFRPSGFESLFSRSAPVFLRRWGCFVAIFSSNGLNARTGPSVSRSLIFKLRGLAKTPQNAPGAPPGAARP